VLIYYNFRILQNKIGLLHIHWKGAGFYGRIISMIVHLPLMHALHGIHVRQHNYYFSYLI